MPLTSDEDIAELLTNARTIAVVGASDRPNRPSYGVMKFLQDWGYRVIPVNPQITGEHVLGEFVWRELAQIGELWQFKTQASVGGKMVAEGQLLLNLPSQSSFAAPE